MPASSTLQDILIMQLKEYPKAIARLQNQTFNFDQAIERIQKTIKDIELEIDSHVAFNPELRNDTQRKAKRKSMLDFHPNYWEQQEILSQTKAKREQVYIELCLRRNEFSLLKLERREAIAKLELQAAS